MRIPVKSTVLAAALLLAAPAASHADVHVMLESRTDAAFPGSDIYLTGYASRADFINGNENLEGYSQLNPAAAYRVADFAIDSSGGYHVMLESRADAGMGSEIYLANYASYADLVAGDESLTGFSQINVAPSFEVRGFTVGADGYHVLFESRADAAMGAEIYITTYDSYADLMNGNESLEGFSQLNVAPAYRVAGFAEYGDTFHVLLESRADAPMGSEFFLADYDSYADLMHGNESVEAFSQLNTSASFEGGGFEYDPPPTDVGGGGGSGGGGGGPVPEPAAWALMILGFGATGSALRAQRHLSSRRRGRATLAHEA